MVSAEPVAIKGEAPKRVRRMALCAGTTLLIALILLTACRSTPVRLQKDYLEFDRNYGDASDQQLLLNLARMANDLPAYFMQLTSINSEYQSTTSAGLSPSWSRTAPGLYQSMASRTIGSIPASGANTATEGYAEYAKEAFTLSGTFNHSLTEMPSFQFVPISGSNMVSAVETPISDKVMQYFYDQGYPADLVARTMVSMAEHVVERIGDATNYECLVNNPRDPSYPKFLEFCSELRDAQQKHYLVVEEKGGKPTILFEATNFNGTNVRLGEITGAAVSNLTVSFTPSNGLLRVSKAAPANTAFTTNVDPNYLGLRDLLKHLGDRTVPESSELLNFWQVPVEENFTQFVLNQGPNFQSGLVSMLNSAIANNEPIRWALTYTNDTNVYVAANNFAQPLLSAHVSRQAIDWRYLEFLYPPLTNRTLFLLTNFSFGPTNYTEYVNVLPSFTGKHLYWDQDPLERLLAAGRIADQFTNYNLKMFTVESAMFTVAKEEADYREYCRPWFVAEDIQNFKRFWTDLHDMTLPASRKLNGKFKRIFDENNSYAGFPVETPKVREWKAGFIHWLNDDVLPTPNLFAESDFPELPDAVKKLWGAYSDFDEMDLKRFNRLLIIAAYGLKGLPYEGAYYWCDSKGPYASFTTTNINGRTNGALAHVAPLMRLTIDTNSDPQESLPAVLAASIMFNSPVDGRKRYFVGDADRDKTQNRLVFTMLTYLYNHTAVSTTNLPVQQVIHLE